MWQIAVKAADAKQAKEIRVLDLRPVTTLADFFVICSGTNSRQIQAISDEIQQSLKKHGERPTNVEGWPGTGEWILMDYGDLPRPYLL